jgi:hypothetical protein
VVKPEDHPDPLPTRQILECVFEMAAGEQFDACRSAFSGPRLARSLDLRRERAADDAYRLEHQAGQIDVLFR